MPRHHGHHPPPPPHHGEHPPPPPHHGGHRPPPPPPHLRGHQWDDGWDDRSVPMLPLETLAEVADFVDVDIAKAMHHVLDYEAPQEWAALVYFLVGMFHRVNRRLDEIEARISSPDEPDDGSVQR